MFHRIRSRIITKVFCVSLPLLLLGLALTVFLLNSGFSQIHSEHQNLQSYYRSDILQLEQRVQELTSRVFAYAEELAQHEVANEAQAGRLALYMAGSEYRGSRKSMIPISRDCVTALQNRPDLSAHEIKSILDALLSFASTRTAFFPTSDALRESAASSGFSEDFILFADRVFSTESPDWFEDELAGNDILANIVPYLKDGELKGIFCLWTDMSEAYDNFDMGDRLELSIKAANLQTDRLQKEQQYKVELEQKREHQKTLVTRSTEKSNDIIAATETKLTLSTVVNMAGLLSCSLVLFWWMGTRRVNHLQQWLAQLTENLDNNNTARNLAAQQLQKPPGYGERWQLLDNDEVGELGQGINFMLERLEKTTVSRHLLEKEISRKKRIENELRNAKSRLEIIFSSVQAGVIIIDAARHRIIDANPAALAMVKAEDKELLGRKCCNFICPFDEGVCPTTREERSGSSTEQNLRTLAGTTIPVIKTETTINLDDEPTTIVCLVDISPLKEAERKMAKAIQKSKQANRIKSEFLANMSHEIRTPLNGILGMTQLAMETRLDEEQKSIFQNVVNEAESLLRIINDILDFSKIEANKLDLESIPFSITSVVEEVAESLSFRAEQKGLEILNYVDEMLPSRVMGDPGRLRQILLNLGGNSVKFTQTGEIILRAELSSDTDDPFIVTFYVIDTGHGIPKDKITTIFDSFTQADGSTTRKYGGTGLGTSISRKLVEMMGGTIGVESTENIGTTFWFTLPFQKVSGLNTAPRHDKLQGLKILVIDDNRTSLWILDKYLSSWGCETDTCTCAEEALHKLFSESERQVYDLILCDQNMAKTSGMEMARRLRSTTYNEEFNIPIIIVSSGLSSAINDVIATRIIQGYLLKPVKKESLQQSITNVLGISSHQKSPEPPSPQPGRRELDRKFHILLVEDYPTNQQIGLRYLVNGGYLVDLAENGLQAVDLFKRNQYSAILMDIQMPEMDGWEATEAIRAIEKSRGTRNRIPIIAMTAHALVGYREKCLELDMDDYIPKPLRKEKLLETVDKWTLLYPAVKNSAIPLNISESSSSTDTETIDLKYLLESLDNDKEFVLEVIRTFLTSCQTKDGQMSSAIQERDFSKLVIDAHTIKGGAYNLSANKLGDIALSLETAARNEQSNQCELYFEQLRSECRNLAETVASSPLFA